MAARSSTTSPRSPLTALLGASALSLAALSITTAPGCATYANYPPIGQDLAINDPNVIPIPVLMRVALTRTLSTDAATGELPERWVLNFPRGTTLERAQSLLESTSRDAGVTGGMLVGDPGFQGLPVYSVTRVWLRADKATVDVIRPVTLDGMTPTEADTSGVAYTYQKITHRLTGGFRPWRVETSRAWPIGLEARPELFGWPEPATGSTSINDPAAEEN